MYIYDISQLSIFIEAMSTAIYSPRLSSKVGWGTGLANQPDKHIVQQSYCEAIKNKT